MGMRKKEQSRFPGSLIITLLLIIIVPLKAQNIIWERTFDMEKSSSAYGVATDKAGNVVVTGLIRDDNGRADWLTLKYNSDGDILWTRVFDANSWDRGAYDVATDFMCNVIVTGKIHTDSTGYDFCTVKYDQDGNILWVRTFSNSDTELEEAHSVAVDSKGNIIVTGFTFSALSGYSYDYLTIKYDPDGNIIWVRTYDGGWNDFAEAVAVDDLDNVIVTGYSDANINWDWCTVKYNPEGDTVWIRRYDVGKDDRAQGVTADGSGSIIVVGVLGESHNSYASVVKYSLEGDTIWIKKFTVEEITSFIDVATDADGNILLAGWYYTFSDGKLQGDFYTAKCDSDCNLIWTDIYNGGVLDEISGIASDNRGNVVVTGSKGEGTPGYMTFDCVTIKYSGTATSIKDGSNPGGFPSGYILHQNYPNPFNGLTKIEYELPARGYVCLKVYDVLGREIVTLADGIEDAGLRSVEFDGTNMPGGVYFYKLMTPAFTDIKKLLILK